jgi:Peptidase family M28
MPEVGLEPTRPEGHGILSAARIANSATPAATETIAPRSGDNRALVDDAGRMELVRELCSIEGRGPGTDAERRAANMLAGRLRGMGRRVEIEPTYVHPQYALVQALNALAALAGSVLASVQPAAGFALVLLAATSMYLDLSTRAYLARSLLFRRASQNVVSPGDRPGAPLRLILTAHYDAGRSGYLFGERALRFARRLSPRGRLLLGPWRIVFWGGIAPLLPILGARMAGVDAQWLLVLQLIPTVLLVVAIFFLLDIALSETVPGAYDNASGVAAVVSAAAELQADPTANLDVWVLLPGAEECLGEGMRSFVRANGGRNGLLSSPTVFVNVDSVSYGSVHFETSEGPLISTRLDPGLVGLCEALAAAGTPASPVRSPLSTDALPAAIRRRRAVSIVGLSEGLPPPWHHTHDDTPERVVGSAMARTSDFVVALARLLDREAGRRPSGDKSQE